MIILWLAESLDISINSFWEVTEESSLENYLGVKFVNYNKGDKFETKQSFLIDQIIESLDFEIRMTNSHSTPAVKPLLHRDTDGRARYTS